MLAQETKGVVMAYCPYIGITDFETLEQVLKMLAVFEDSKQTGIRRKLMIGVMMSYKTLKNIPCLWQLAWISKEEISAIFLNHPSTYNTIHYADYVGRSSSGGGFN